MPSPTPAELTQANATPNPEPGSLADPGTPEPLNPDTGLEAIEVDTELYALPPAHDTLTATQPRGYQSETQFQSQKASYTALKPREGGSYEEFNGLLDRHKGEQRDGVGEERVGKLRLGKKEVVLLGYAVGDLYYWRRFGDVQRLCERVGGECVVDAKVGETLERWGRRAGERVVELDRRDREGEKV